MSEPTREQIKEAFKKTIERWEKIVEDVEYYRETYCHLCYLDSPDTSCNALCPIRDYGGDDEHIGCADTPYNAFWDDKTSANALAELNFLRKVYIWWMEGEGKKNGWMFIKVDKEEKKEEWEDVTEKIEWKTENHGNNDYMLLGYNGSQEVVHLHPNGIYLRYTAGAEDLYKVEQNGDYFCILKRK